MLKNRVLAAVLAAMVALVSMPAMRQTARAAGEVQIVGLPRTTETLTAQHNLGEDVTYQWQVAISTNPFEDIEGATASTLYVDSEIASRPALVNLKLYNGNSETKKVRVVVTSGSETYTSEPITMEQGLGPTNRIENAASTKEQMYLTKRQENSPAEYRFKLSGSDKEFILLEEYDNGYYILARNTYGKHAFDTSAFTAGKGDQEFDPENENNIAYWLNNDFLTSGNGAGNVLPQEIVDHLVLARYRTESGATVTRYTDKSPQKKKGASTIPSDYAAEAKVVLLSQSELMQYAPKIGILDGESWRTANDAVEGWMLRSVRGINNATDAANIDDYLYVSWAPNRKFQTQGAKLNVETSIRPAFTLDKDFFKAVKVDLTSLQDRAETDMQYGVGRMENVVKTILRDMNADELEAAGYNETEILSLLGDTSLPAAALTEKPAIICAGIDIGETLTADYALAQGAADASEVRWQQSADGEDWKTIGFGKTYTLLNEQAEQYVRAVVYPRDGMENAPFGKPTASEAVGPVSKQLSPLDRIMTPAGYKEQSPAENVFTVGGKEFILLQGSKNDPNGFFILAKDYYGKHSYDANKKQRFDPENEDNVAYWLNNTFLTAGNGDGNQLPSEIVDHLVVHRWKTEGGHQNNADKASTVPNDYIAVGKVALLSQTEYLAHIGKIGVLDRETWGTTDSDGWWLRSTRMIQTLDTDRILMVSHNGSRKGQTDAKVTNTEFLIRPAFYLNQDFFKTVKLDLTSVGETVLDTIKTYSAGELLRIYSEEELKSIGMEWENLAFGEMAIVDGSGKAITDKASLQIAARIQATVEIETIDNSKDMMVCLAVYDANGSLLKLDMDAKAANSYPVGDVVFDMAIAGMLPQADHMKVLVWDNFGNLRPLLENLTLLR